MPSWRRETILDIYNLVLGVFLFAAPWLFSYARGIAGTDDWMSSALIVASSVAALLAFAEWEEWISLIVALWVLASPWLLGFQHTPAAPINIGVGLTIAYLSALELWLLHYSPAPQGRDGAGTATT
jgi:hypothetical protein